MDGLRAIFWNIAGTKSLGEKDWKYIKTHEIIGLSETWEEEGRGSSRKQLTEYEVRQRYAKREKKKGRAKGGLLLAVKKGCGIEADWDEEESDEALAMNWMMEGERWTWGVIYMGQNRKENYEIMNKWIEKGKEGITILCGDFNARTEKEGGLWDSSGEKEERRSKDTRMNEEGKEMVKWLEENGMGIGNGATEGDERGEWTFIGGRGCTTIDYVVRNEAGRDKIKSMKVGERLKSDHLPLEIKLQASGKKREEEKGQEKKKIIVWEEGGEEVFKEKLLEQGEKLNWKDFKEKIQRALPVKEIRQKEGNNKEKWWDEECHREKMKLKEGYRKLRKGEKSEEEWRRMRRGYRDMIKGKKRKRNIEWLNEIEEDKSMKTFWKEVGGKRRREAVDKSIPKEQWREHFRKQYVVKEDREEEGEWREEKPKEEIEEITIEEIRETIRRLKNKKAPGHDGITNEAWKRGGEVLEKELKEIIYEIWKGGEMPEEWKTGTVKPIFKKGKTNDVGNYRGITLIDTGYKIYERF